MFDYKKVKLYIDAQRDTLRNLLNECEKKDTVVIDESRHKFI